MGMSGQLEKELQISGATDDTPIGNTGDSLKVDVTASALPIGAATSSNQTTMITSLTQLVSATATTGSTISRFEVVGGQLDDVSTQLVGEGQVGAARITQYRALHTNLRDATGNELVGQKAMSASVPVALASDQSAISTTVSGTVDTNISQYGGVSTSLGQTTMASSVPVAPSSDWPMFGNALLIPNTVSGATNVNAASSSGINDLVLVRNTGATKYIYIQYILVGSAAGSTFIFQIWENVTFSAAGSSFGYGSRAAGSGGGISNFGLTTAPTVTNHNNLLETCIISSAGNSQKMGDGLTLAIAPGGNILITGQPAANNKVAYITVCAYEP